MPGRIIYIPPGKHVCTDLPLAAFAVLGTIWQCDECDQQWELTLVYHRDEEYRQWREVNREDKGGTK